MSRETSSIAAIPLEPIFDTKSLASLKAVPRPHNPSLSANARPLTSVAPVADTYTTLAFGSIRCNSTPAFAI